jgi:hypothetical protein
MWLIIMHSVVEKHFSISIAPVRSRGESLVLNTLGPESVTFCSIYLFHSGNTRIP